MKKRLLAIILACAMAVACMPVVAFADDVQEPGIEENDTTQFSRIMRLIRNLAQAYANDPEVVEKIEQLNAIIDEYQDSLVHTYDLVDDYQDKLNEAVALIQEGKIDELPGLLEEIPFAEIDAKIADLTEDIETAVRIAGAIAANIKDNETAQQIGAIIQELVEEVKEIQAYVMAEDFGIAKMVSDYQALLQEHQDEILDAALDLVGKAEAFEDFIMEKYPEAYDAIKGYMEKIRDNIPAAAEADSEAAQNIKEALGTILAYIGGSEEAAQTITGAIEAKLDDIAAQAKAYKELAQQKLAQIQQAIIVIAESVKNIDYAEVAQKIKQAALDIIQKVQEGVLVDILTNMTEQIKTAIAQVKESGVVADTIQNFLDKVQSLREVVKAIEEIKPLSQIKSLNDLKEVAEALLKQYGTAIIMNLVQRFQNGDFDCIFEKMGMTKEEAMAKLVSILPYIIDIKAYVEGLMNDKGYLVVEFEADQLQFLNDILEEENAGLEAQVAALEIADADLQSYYKTNSANQKNAIKVAKGKPVLQAAVSSKKGKKSNG